MDKTFSLRSPRLTRGAANPYFEMALSMNKLGQAWSEKNQKDRMDKKRRKRLSNNYQLSVADEFVGTPLFLLRLQQLVALSKDGIDRL